FLGADDAELLAQFGADEVLAAIAAGTAEVAGFELAARRIDGAHQYFSRANDFGFSKTSAETFTIWDKEQVLSDMVWVIRQRRPDVLITRFPPDARAGHGHHQASAILAAEAFDAAGDPNRFPEQLKYVQVWQPKRLYWNTGSYFVKPGESMDGYLQLDAGGYNPLLGESYGEIAAHSRSQHRSQGFGAAAQRGEAIEYFQFVKGTPAKTDLFEGVDQTWNRVPGGAAIGKMVSEVIQKYDAANPSASVAALEKISAAVQKLDVGQKYNFWQDEKLVAIANLIQAASGVFVEAIASAPTTVSGGATAIAYEMVNRSGYPVKLNLVTANGDFFPGDPSMQVLDSPELAAAQAIELGSGKRASGSIVAKSRNSFLISQPYWLREMGSIGMYKLPKEFAPPQLVGKPENAPVYTASFHYAVNGGPVQVCTVPVQYKHTDPTLGELYQPLAVVPPVMVNIPPARAYVFADQQPKQVPVTLRAGQAGVAGSLALQVPAGWQAEPATVAFNLKNKDDEQTVNFMLRPLAGAAAGKAELRAVATVGTEKYSRGIQQII
ncbi:MAG: LmbE family protein, partial [Hymenobacter sp.]